MKPSDIETKIETMEENIDAAIEALRAVKTDISDLRMLALRLRVEQAEKAKAR